MVPEFVSICEDIDGPYMVLIGSTPFIPDNVHNIALTQKCFNFVNTALETGGEETETCIVVQLFELWAENENTILFSPKTPQR
ncbi:MAG: hypothetical protein V4543_11855 [Bacteroidota bacterium]